MGSIIDTIECPNCSNEAISDFYYKTGEEYIHCQHCGYHYSATIKDRTKRLDELTDDDWEIQELKNPFCAYKIKQYDTIGYTCGSLENQEQLDILKANCENDSTIEYSTVEYISISRFVNGEIIQETILDNGPKFDGAGFSKEDR